MEDEGSLRLSEVSNIAYGAQQREVCAPCISWAPYSDQGQIYSTRQSQEFEEWTVASERVIQQGKGRKGKERREKSREK